jgi:hypothetical protein
MWDLDFGFLQGLEARISSKTSAKDFLATSLHQVRLLSQHCVTGDLSASCRLREFLKVSANHSVRGLVIMTWSVIHLHHFSHQQTWPPLSRRQMTGNVPDCRDNLPAVTR